MTNFVGARFRTQDLSLNGNLNVRTDDVRNEVILPSKMEISM
jgi:hypothetical protein